MDAGQGRRSADRLADAINHSERELYGGSGTSISGAIDQAIVLLSQSPYQAQRRTIDISGDGPNSSGRPVTRARDEAVAQGIGINGLPILSIDRRLDNYYYSYVIGGPGAFMIPAANYENFAEAIVKKLILEIAAIRRRLVLGAPCWRANVKSMTSSLPDLIRQSIVKNLDAGCIGTRIYPSSRTMSAHIG